jgi:hypothetical protein
VSRETHGSGIFAVRGVGQVIIILTGAFAPLFVDDDVFDVLMMTPMAWPFLLLRAEMCAICALYVTYD